MSTHQIATNITLTIINNVLINCKNCIVFRSPYRFVTLFEYGNESGNGSISIFFFENHPKKIQAITNPYIICCKNIIKIPPSCWSSCIVSGENIEGPDNVSDNPINTSAGTHKLIACIHAPVALYASESGLDAKIIKAQAIDTIKILPIKKRIFNNGFKRLCSFNGVTIGHHINRANINNTIVIVI